MSVSKGGNRQTQAGTSSVDGTTMQYLQQIMQAAQQAGAAGPSPLVNGATGYNTSAMNAGQTGLAALSGDQNAVSSLMNPYTSNVINAMRDQANQTNQAGMTAINGAATQAGAFGGSRQGVATGTMLSQNARDLNSNIAGLLSGGFNDAMNRAGSLAGMGFQGAGSNANLGMGGVGSPQQWMLSQLRGGFVMPTGQQYNNSGSNVSGGMSLNPFKMFQGGA